MKSTGRRAWRQAGRRFRKAAKRQGMSPGCDVGIYARRHWRNIDGNNGIWGNQFPPAKLDSGRSKPDSELPTSSGSFEGLSERLLRLDDLAWLRMERIGR